MHVFEMIRWQFAMRTCVCAYVSTHRQNINSNSIRMRAKKKNTYLHIFTWIKASIGRGTMEKREMEKKTEAKYFHNHISTLLYIYTGFLRLFFFPLSFLLGFFGQFFSSLFFSVLSASHCDGDYYENVPIFFLYTRGREKRRRKRDRERWRKKEKESSEIITKKEDKEVVKRPALHILYAYFDNYTKNNIDYHYCLSDIYTHSWHFIYRYIYRHKPFLLFSRFVFISIIPTTRWKEKIGDKRPGNIYIYIHI